MTARAADGRRIMSPPCELGHRVQAMECPSCSERITGKPSSAEWWTWYEKRYSRKRGSVSAVGGEGT